VLVVPVFSFFITPLASLWSRRHEFEADAFATRHAGAAELATALVSCIAITQHPDTGFPVYAASTIHIRRRSRDRAPACLRRGPKVLRRPTRQGM